MSSTYTPYIMDISDISKAKQAVVSYDTDHPYTLGEIVSFRVSKPYGMVEMNNKQSRVVDLTSDTITTEIDSTNFRTFVLPPEEDIVYPALTVPAGSGIIPGLYTPTVNLEDAFDNRPTS